MRLAATIRCDVRLQWRNGFYYASAVIVVGSVVLIAWLPQAVVDVMLPIVILQNVMVNSFYFVAGLILLENAERTRAAQSVTPLRRGEYLGAKVITLGVLSLVESLILVAAGYGAGRQLVVPAIGIAIASILATLLGAALVARYRAINDFIMPSVLYTLILGLPMLGWFGVGAPILYDWHPLQGPLAMIGSTVEPLSAGRLAYAIGWPLLWVAPAYLWSRRAIARNVVA